MEHTYEELSKKTVAQLREIAKELDDPGLRGYTQLNKAHLLPAVCNALGIEAHEHHEVVGLNKAEIKAKIKELKVERNSALEAHDHKQLKAIRRKIHGLKRQLRKSMA
jgi:hypothetical protein